MEYKCAACLEQGVQRSHLQAGQGNAVTAEFDLVSDPPASLLPEGLHIRVTNRHQAAAKCAMKVFLITG